ncbi:MAG: glutamate--tRNA ligase [Candidatus Omnitrophota bacterium]
MEKVKVRFAPSPTGYLHVGSARTALFNWLFARHMGGEFVLRIEDTDRVRSKDEFLEEILESLKWLGLTWDGELEFQSKRLELYRQRAKELVDAGKAYESEGAIHLKMPQKKVHIADVVHGDIEFDTALIKDQVLIKSDGFPTYNFACVIDDASMGMTHIIRGDDHISNTPKQIVIYEAMNLTSPRFCHIPLILGVDRSRLSKRHGATSIRDYRAEGYLPEALVNYLCLLGWSPGNDKELMPIDGIIKAFSLEQIVKTAAVFDVNKLVWVNGQYLKNYDTAKLTGMIIDELKKEGLYQDTLDRAWLAAIVVLYKERIKTLAEFTDLAGFYFKETIEYDPEGVAKHFTEGFVAILTKVSAQIEALPVFDHAAIESCVRALATELGVKAAAIIHPLRLAATGRTAGASLFETLVLLGKEKTLRNIKNALAKFG